MNMQTIYLPYGTTKQEVRIPVSNLQDIYEIGDQNTQPLNELSILKLALENPIGSPRIADIAGQDMRVAIITSDNTRPCPTTKLLPPILAELEDAGVQPENITIVFGLGLHRTMTESDIHELIPLDVSQKYHLKNHNAEDTIFLGTTSRGTPIEVFRPVAEADLRICLGNLEFHYFAGFSGGAKAIIPGCASQDTITANHGLMVQPEARAGILKGNPVREDLEEAANSLGPIFLLNVIVDNHNIIRAAFSGDITAAHRVGCDHVISRGAISQASPADIVIVSAGGFPKDINLYQAQKALDNASHAVRDGGIIILVAECREGFGNKIFETWMHEAYDPERLLKKIKQNFVLGGHKAAAIAAILRRTSIYLVSSLPWTSVSNCSIQPYENIDKALEAALLDIGENSSIVVMPHGGSMLPMIDINHNLAI
jgi:lactate racemase